MTKHVNPAKTEKHTAAKAKLDDATVAKDQAKVSELKKDFGDALDAGDIERAMNDADEIIKDDPKVLDEA